MLVLLGRSAASAGPCIGRLYKLYRVQVRSFEQVSVLTFDLYNLNLSGLECLGFKVWGIGPTPLNGLQRFKKVIQHANSG